VYVAPTAGATVGVPVTYEDFTYDSSVKRPSENKPQSKLWYADGAWWALLAGPADDRVHIFELRADHSWRDTGTVVDDRLNSTGDALWSAGTGTLTVASRESSTNLRVTRFAYRSSDRSWSRAAGFPVSVNTGGGSESATIDQDSTGRLWVTYTRASKVWVAHSDPSGLSWTAGFNPNVPDYSIKSDDISAIISFQGQIGLMWSDQGSDAFRFARHKDGDPDSAWVVEDALSGPDLADDHINLKGLVDDPQGRLFAAIKTSQDTYGPGATLVGVLVRTPKADGTGSWRLAPAGTVADDHTRPIIMVDKTNQDLYFFATAPVSGGDIYYKVAPLSNVAFGPGRGAKFIDAKPVVNNASGAKEPVTAATGLVVLAVAEGKKKYVHGEMELAGGTTPPPPPPGDTQDPSTPTGLAATTTQSSVALSWDPSSDDTGVTGYEVRDGTTQVANVAGTSTTIDNLAAGSSHSYTVRAYDAAGNRSAWSDALAVTLPGSPPPPPPSGAISLRDVTTGANNAEATLTVAAPAAQAGDVLLATVDYRGKSAVTAPAGWTTVRTDVNGTTMTKATFVRVATASEPASWTWRFGAKPGAVGQILAYSGVSTSSPVESADGSVNGKSRDVTAPAVTTQRAGDVVVGLFGVPRDTTVDPPAGTTELSEVTSPAGLTYPMTAEAAHVVPFDVGPTSALVATSSVSSPSIGHTIVLRAS
jgi:chitodextrinase